MSKTMRKKIKRLFPQTYSRSNLIKAGFSLDIATESMENALSVKVWPKDIQEGIEHCLSLALTVQQALSNIGIAISKIPCNEEQGLKEMNAQLYGDKNDE